MKLTPEQLHIMQRARKDLTFGCLAFDLIDIRQYAGDCRGWYCSHGWSSGIILEGKIIGHPLDRGRLCYLYSCNGEVLGEFQAMEWYAYGEKNILQLTVLERPLDFQKLVIAFLESLPDNTTTEGN